MKKYINESELKQIQLDILNNVAQFCDTRNIGYFLAYGTLIGAIRHNGYIPWDDDIDIAMPRPDYDKFINEYHDDNGVYKVICHSNNSNYGLPFAKVFHTGTVMRETQYIKDEYGVYIDIFPIDGFKSKKLLRRAQKYRRLLNAKKANWQGNRPLFKKMAMAMVRIIYIGLPISRILDKIDEICRKGEYESSEIVGYIPTLNSGMKDIIDKRLVSRTIKHPFENRIYNIPVGYDLYLRQLYGDYMQLPPVEKRQSTHLFEAWWK